MFGYALAAAAAAEEIPPGFHSYALAVAMGFPALTSAGHAKARLHDVIRADRAAVPCGRWGKTSRPIDELGFGGEFIAGPLIEAASLFGRMGVLFKPRYRWEVRR